jgi:peptidyl-prolyl cis-trans isomerase NIMA-interacting 1
MRDCLWVLCLALACDKGSSPAATGASAAVSASTATTTIGSASETVLETSSSSATSKGAPTTSGAEIAPPEAIIAQHVLIAYRGAKRAPKGVTRAKTEAKARALEALAQIRAGTPLEDAVRTYSDDQGSADRMGSLGKFRKGDMDPAFGAAAFALKVGEVSDVVETPFGFHIIKRTQ